jgi:hypothetical protein
LRVAELRQKSAVRAHVALLSLMLVQQPKLLVSATLSAMTGSTAQFDIVWDPLSESPEPVDCPRCGQPTFALDLSSSPASRLELPQVTCANCAKTSHAPAHRRR